MIEKFTDLPLATNANMSDIIAAVQGYVSPSVLGSLNQESLQQVFNLFLANTILSNHGNPNGSVAGNTFQLLWDTLGLALYMNTVSGNASTAVWTLIAQTSSPGLQWVTVGAATATLAPNTGYIINYSGGAATLTLPTVSAIGDEIVVMGFSSGGYSIAQNVGQQIIIASDTTTSGAGGSITTTNQYDAITLRCMMANTIWGTPCGVQGIFTIV